ncbi:MAG: hypothetical protein SPL21_03475 [Fibrobacter sp.]|nr:hypothetical protein [Fibrobacter sp.]
MVSVKRFIHDEPALFKATAEFVRLFARVDDPVLAVAIREKTIEARIAWTLFGTALFQDVSYPEFVTLLRTLNEKFPGEKLWTLPVPKAQDIEDCVETAFGCRSWSMFENVAGIFWSVGLFVRRHLDLRGWLKSRTPEEIWRDLGEIYFMGKGNPRPKVCAAIYRLLAPAPVGLGLDCAPSPKRPPLPLTMGARRYLSILGPASDGFADLEPAQKQKLATDMYVALVRYLMEQSENAEVKKSKVDALTAYVAAHSLQFYLEDGAECFICRQTTEHCRKCPLREFCSYAE